MKIAIDLTAYEILLLRGALSVARDVGILEEDETMELSRRLGVELQRFPLKQLEVAKAAFTAEYEPKA